MIRSVKALSAAVILLGLVGGVPLALLRLGAWPIHGVPSVDSIRAVPTEALSDSAVYAVLTVAAWVAWAAFVLSLAVELASELAGLRRVRLPLLGPFQVCAQRLLGALIVTVSVGVSGTLPAHALAVGSQPNPARSAPAAALPAPEGELLAAEPTPVAATPARDSQAVVVAPGDSPWSIAEQHLGSGLRWRELFDLNSEVPQADGSTWTDPQRISVGWTLQLPQAEPATMPGAALAPASPVASAEETWVVRPGDTLTSIAVQVWGDGRRYSELFEANRAKPQADGASLIDPDLIDVGWVLDVPTTAPAAAVVAPASATPLPPADAMPVGVAAEFQDAPPSPDDDLVALDPDPTTPPSLTPTTLAPTTTSAPTPTTALVDPALQPRSAALPVTPPEMNTGADELFPMVAARVLGISGALVLAAGLAERLRRGRERRSVRSAALLRPTEQEAAHEVAIAAQTAGDLPLVRWAAQSIAQCLAVVDAANGSAYPVAVEIGESALQIMWSAPASPVPHPWSPREGGWTWRLPYDPAAAVPAAELPSPLPALVTVGRRGRNALLIDLEALGAVGVSGPDESVSGLLRAIASEFALGEELSDAYVATVGVTAIADHSGVRASTISESQAIARLRTARGAVESLLQSERCPSTFARRAGIDGVPTDVLVVVADNPSSAAVDEFASTATAHRGVAAMIADRSAACSARIVINDDGYAVLYPLGIGFDAAYMPASTATASTDLIRSADERTAPAPAPAPAPDSQACGRSLPLRHTDPVDVTVRVLGVPRVRGERALGPRETCLAAFLACRRRPATTAHIQEAIWGGRPVQAKTIWNLVSRTRHALGSTSDGSPAFPQADQATRTFALAPHVSTDLDVLRDACRLTVAFDASDIRPDADPSTARHLLEEALRLVEGRPFDAAGYDWAYRDGQHAAEACELIEQASLRLCRLARAAGDERQARWALTVGLIGLPGNEPLYRERMSLEAAGGNRSGLESAFDELCCILADLDTEPSPESFAHRAHLRARVALDS